MPIAADSSVSTSFGTRRDLAGGHRAAQHTHGPLAQARPVQRDQTRDRLRLAHRHHQVPFPKNFELLKKNFDPTG
jgi:hypothetical protein